MNWLSSPHLQECHDGARCRAKDACTTITPDLFHLLPTYQVFALISSNGVHNVRSVMIPVRCPPTRNVSSRLADPRLVFLRFPFDGVCVRISTSISGMFSVSPHVVACFLAYAVCHKRPLPSPPHLYDVEEYEHQTIFSLFLPVCIYTAVSYHIAVVLVLVGMHHLTAPPSPFSLPDVISPSFFFYSLSPPPQASLRSSRRRSTSS